MVCAASESLLGHLTTLPKPTIVADTKKFIKEVRDRKPEKKKVATTVAEAAATSRGGSFSMALLAALVAAVVVVGGFFVYTQMKSTKAKAAGLGKLTAKGAEERPAWLTSDAPNSSYCNDTDGGGMSCVGVSAVAPNQEDGADEAKDAALEAVANGLVVRMHDEKWDRMAGLWSQTRQARMGEYDKDPTSSSARRGVRDGRRQVAALLRATAGAAVPAAPTGGYWEEYDNGGTKQYLAFAQFQLSPSEVKGLVDRYNRTATALGATVATVYPMVAWRYPQVAKGAVIVALDKGQLRDMGLATQFVILGVGNDENAMATVSDAADFAEKAAAAYAKIEKPGGKMFVSVERGADEPKVYDLSVAAPKVETPVDHGGGNHDRGGNDSGTGTHRGTGSVNVWDRYGGSGAGNRDDPTQ
jgi:hypothetical protein